MQACESRGRHSSLSDSAVPRLILQPQDHAQWRCALGCTARLFWPLRCELHLILHFPVKTVPLSTVEGIRRSNGAITCQSSERKHHSATAEGTVYQQTPDATIQFRQQVPGPTPEALELGVRPDPASWGVENPQETEMWWLDLEGTLRNLISANEVAASPSFWYSVLPWCEFWKEDQTMAMA